MAEERNTERLSDQEGTAYVYLTDGPKPHNTPTSRENTGDTGAKVPPDNRAVGGDLSTTTASRTEEDILADATSGGGHTDVASLDDDQLKERAASLGIDGAAGMNRADLERAIAAEEANRTDAAETGTDPRELRGDPGAMGAADDDTNVDGVMGDEKVTPDAPAPSEVTDDAIDRPDQAGKRPGKGKGGKQLP